MSLVVECAGNRAAASYMNYTQPERAGWFDPVNFAGMVAADILCGDMPQSHWDASEDGFLLDVREAAERAVESVPGSLNIPLGELRARLGELPRDREILVICRSGQRAYYATRALLQNGFKATTVAGGMLSRFHTYLLDN